MTPLEQRTANTANSMLEVIDFSDGGVPIAKIEEIMMKAISFSVFVRVLNDLIAKGLIHVDAQHIAHRVRS